ncbi:MAG: hydroxymethylbilane synthase [Limisphaerales bacterium]|nr:hydroxymethylbilane synthase [Verrucomicrobiota bacterium]
MPNSDTTTSMRKIVLATRGSPLALAQAHRVLNTCSHYFPKYSYEIRIIKTTGDKLQTASLSHADCPTGSPPKGLFTKELEEALLDGSADMAIHSLKDLPTELPEGLTLGGVLRRADVRDLLIYRSTSLAETLQAQCKDWTPGTRSYRGFRKNLKITELPKGAVVATSSTRRQQQILHLRSDIQIIPIRGNVGTRIQKLRMNPEIDATILAAAGLERLEFHLFSDGHFTAPPKYANVPLEGILGSRLSSQEMLTCVGQGAIGIEIRQDDELMSQICREISHPSTALCVAAEREFLRALGGGCQSPVAAHAQVRGHTLQMDVVSFRVQPPKSARVSGKLSEAKQIGQQAAKLVS